MITNDYNSGGLGVSDLAEMNATLLVKWIYQYVNEKIRLWRWVVSAKSGTSLRSLFLTFSGRNRRAILANLVGSFLDKNEKVLQIISDRFKLLIRNGRTHIFW